MARKKQSQFLSGVSEFLFAIGRIFKSPIVLAWLLAIGGLVALTAVSVPKLRATHISTATVKVTFSNPPQFLHDSLLGELQNLARIHLSKTTVGREGLIKTADALLATGWFTNIEQVKWINSDHAVIEATFLEPYARVHDAEGDVFIDKNARILPTRSGMIAIPTRHFVTLRQLKHRRPQRPGLQWDGGDVSDAIALLNLIYNKPWVTQIQSIDLSKWPGDGSMVLVTDMPSYLNWGSAPGEERALEALADKKIDRLNRINSRDGRIDQGAKTEFDLTNNAQVVRSYP